MIKCVYFYRLLGLLTRRYRKMPVVMKVTFVTKGVFFLAIPTW